MKKNIFKKILNFKSAFIKLFLNYELKINKQFLWLIHVFVQI